MPLYEYECENCLRRWEASHPVERRMRERCDQCGPSGKPRIVISASVQVSGFNSYWECNLGTEPVHIRSARHLDAECEARGFRVKGGGSDNSLFRHRIEEHDLETSRAIDRKARSTLKESHARRTGKA
mgnify:CR=1 FL=1